MYCYHDHHCYQLEQDILSVNTHTAQVQVPTQAMLLIAIEEGIGIVYEKRTLWYSAELVFRYIIDHESLMPPIKFIHTNDAYALIDRYRVQSIDLEKQTVFHTLRVGTLQMLKRLTPHSFGLLTEYHSKPVHAQIKSCSSSPSHRRHVPRLRLSDLQSSKSEDTLSVTPQAITCRYMFYVLYLGDGQALFPECHEYNGVFYSTRLGDILSTISYSDEDKRTDHVFRIRKLLWRTNPMMIQIACHHRVTHSLQFENYLILALENHQIQVYHFILGSLIYTRKMNDAVQSLHCVNAILQVQMKQESLYCHLRDGTILNQNSLSAHYLSIMKPDMTWIMMQDQTVLRWKGRDANLFDDPTILLTQIKSQPTELFYRHPARGMFYLLLHYETLENGLRIRCVHASEIRLKCHPVEWTISDMAILLTMLEYQTHIDMFLKYAISGKDLLYDVNRPTKISVSVWEHLRWYIHAMSHKKTIISSPKLSPLIHLQGRKSPRLEMVSKYHKDESTLRCISVLPYTLYFRERKNPTLSLEDRTFMRWYGASQNKLFYIIKSDQMNIFKLVILFEDHVEILEYAAGKIRRESLSVLDYKLTHKDGQLDFEAMLSYLHRQHTGTIHAIQMTNALNDTMFKIHHMKMDVLAKLDMGLIYRTQGQYDIRKLMKNKPSCEAWQNIVHQAKFDKSCNVHVGSELSKQDFRRFIGNSMCIMIYNDSNEIIDPTQFHFGEMSVFFSVIKPEENGYQVGFYFNLSVMKTPFEQIQYDQFLAVIKHTRIHPETPAGYVFEASALLSCIIEKSRNAVQLCLEYHPRFSPMIKLPMSSACDKLAQELLPTRKMKHRK